MKILTKLSIKNNTGHNFRANQNGGQNCPFKKTELSFSNGENYTM